MPSSSSVSDTGDGEEGAADGGGELIGEFGAAGIGLVGAGGVVALVVVTEVEGEAMEERPPGGVSTDNRPEGASATGVEGVGLDGAVAAGTPGGRVVGVGVVGVCTGGGEVGSPFSVLSLFVGSLFEACSLLRLLLASAILAASTPTNDGN